MNKRKRKKWLKNEKWLEDHKDILLEIAFEAVQNTFKRALAEMFYPLYQLHKAAYPDDFTEEGFYKGGYVGLSPLCEISPIIKTGEMAGEYIRKFEEAH